MKSNILIGILVAFCAVQVINAGMLDNLQAQLKKTKSKVETIVSDLKRTKNNIELNANGRISNFKLQSMQSVNNFVNPALNQIRDDVDAAKAEGKNAEHCYDSAKDKLRTVSKNAFASLDAVEKQAKQSVQAALNTLDNVQSTGNQLIAELDGVFPACYSNNIMQMQTCIALKLGTINVSIRTYESTVSSTKLAAERAANNAVNAANSSFNPIVSNSISETTSVRLSTNQCLRDLS